MEEKEVAQGLFDGGVRKTFCGKKEMYVALMAEPTFSQFSKFMPVSKKGKFPILGCPLLDGRQQAPV